MTRMQRFGTGKRESHDASGFYDRKMMKTSNVEIVEDLREKGGGWSNKIYCGSSELMTELPNSSIALTFTSPPYNVGKEYDDDLSFSEYTDMLARVMRKIYIATFSGGRLAINVANLGRKPMIPMTQIVYNIANDVGFLPVAEIIWQKAEGSNGSCAWGSWNSAKSPQMRDIHEYVLIFAKDLYGRPDKGESTMTKEEFMQSTLSVWQIRPESAKKIGHPAPFPKELARRIINLYSYKDDVVLDPFVGSGTTCLVAKQMGRQYVGYDTSEAYCEMARKRIG